VPYGCREWFERYRPGGWWRRDLLLAVLAETYPAWLSAPEIEAICRAVRPDWRGRWPEHDRYTARTLGRLYGLGLVDRIGRFPGFAGRLPGTDWKRGWLKKPGHRYRLIRRTERT
jgi:hypothetical protein